MKPPSPQEIISLPWWVERILLPSLFLFLGACIGFMGTWIRDTIEARRAKNAFLKAIRCELIGLQAQLSSSIAEVEAALDRLFSTHHIPVFAVSFGIIVFSSQLTKLRDVNDPLVLEIIELSSAIPGLEDVGRLLNERSKEALSLKPAEQKSPAELKADDKWLQALEAVGSACRVLLERLRPVHSRVNKLVSKLPE